MIKTEQDDYEKDTDAPNRFFSRNCYQQANDPDFKILARNRCNFFKGLNDSN